MICRVRGQCFDVRFQGVDSRPKSYEVSAQPIDWAVELTFGILLSRQDAQLLDSVDVVLGTEPDLHRAAKSFNALSLAIGAVGPTLAHFSILDVVLTTASNPYIALPMDRQLTLGRATLSLTESLLNVTNKQDCIAIGQRTWDHPVECGKVSRTKVHKAQT